MKVNRFSGYSVLKILSYPTRHKKSRFKPSLNLLDLSMFLSTYFWKSAQFV